MHSTKAFEDLIMSSDICNRNNTLKSLRNTKKMKHTCLQEHFNNWAWQYHNKFCSMYIWHTSNILYKILHNFILLLYFLPPPFPFVLFVFILHLGATPIHIKNLQHSVHTSTDLRISQSPKVFTIFPLPKSKGQFITILL